jgi:hypothetical protein
MSKTTKYSINLLPQDDETTAQSLKPSPNPISSLQIIRSKTMTQYKFVAMLKKPLGLHRMEILEQPPSHASRRRNLYDLLQEP